MSHFLNLVLTKHLWHSSTSVIGACSIGAFFETDEAIVLEDDWTDAAGCGWIITCRAGNINSSIVSARFKVDTWILVLDFGVLFGVALGFALDEEEAIVSFASD